MIRLEAYKGKWVAVFGLGKAGLAAVRALLASDALVYVWDDSEKNRKTFVEELGQVRYGQMRLEPVEQWAWDTIEVMVLSPGVPFTHPKPHPAVSYAQQKNVKIMGEVDLLYRACPDATYIGITGTNGKSTTTALVHHILKHNHYDAQIGANFGVPALALDPKGEGGYYVLEMSSYQLDLTRHAVFNAALLLNVTPDHIDRHGDMEGYVKAKKRIFQRQGENDAAIISVDDGFCRDVYVDMVREHRKHLIPVSVTQGAQLHKMIEVDEQGMLRDRYNSGSYSYDLQKFSRLKGRHNWQNIACAYAICRRLGLRPEYIMEATASFPGLPHRLELVATHQGVEFVNDSKATNADATERALQPYEDIYWILGGKAKAGGITSLEPWFPKIKHAFLLGDAEEEFAATLEGKVPYTRCGTLEVATEKATDMALSDLRGHGVVLLSPACASFDQWKSYEHRGDAFREYVQQFTAKFK